MKRYCGLPHNLILQSRLNHLLNLEDSNPSSLDTLVRNVPFIALVIAITALYGVIRLVVDDVAVVKMWSYETFVDS